MAGYLMNITKVNKNIKIYMHAYMYRIYNVPYPVFFCHSLARRGIS